MRLKSKKLVSMSLVAGMLFSLSAFSASAADTPGVGNYSFYLGKGLYSVTRPGVTKVKVTSKAVNSNSTVDNAKYSLQSRILNNDESKAVTNWVSFDEGNRITMSYTSQVYKDGIYKLQIEPNSKETAANIYASGTWSPDDKNDF